MTDPVTVCPLVSVDLDSDRSSIVAAARTVRGDKAFVKG